MKAPKVPRPIVSVPSLLVFKEKHGERYFHVADDDAVYRVALHVLIGRQKEGYWYGAPTRVPKPPDVTAEGVEQLPESLRGPARRMLLTYKKELAEFTARTEEYARIQGAITDRNGKDAWDILMARGDYEYEGFSLEHYETPRLGG